jgi:hypothetical protein
MTRGRVGNGVFPCDFIKCLNKYIESIKKKSVGQIYVIRLEIRGLERKMISKVKSQRDCVH